MCGVGAWGLGEQRLWGWGVLGALLPEGPGAVTGRLWGPGTPGDTSWGSAVPSALSTGARSCVWGQRCRARGDAGAAGPGAASSLCPGFPRREQKGRGLEPCLGTVSSGALGASGEPAEAGGRSAEPRELRRRGQGCGMGRGLPKAPLGCTPQGARGHSSAPHTDMETRPRAVPRAGELRGPGPGPSTRGKERSEASGAAPSTPGRCP